MATQPRHRLDRLASCATSAGARRLLHRRLPEPGSVIREIAALARRPRRPVPVAEAMAQRIQLGL
jgi:hypothetical protein